MVLFGLVIVINVYLLDANKLIEQILNNGGVLKHPKFVFTHTVLFAILISFITNWGPTKVTLKHEIYTFKLSGYVGLISWLYFSVKLILRMIV